MFRPKQRRASYGKDVLDLLFYHDLAHGQVHNIRQFFRAASETPHTFNSFYMDDRNIGVFTSGLVPIRPKNVDPDLPIDGTGREEWRGFVSFKNHPQGMNPPTGEIINWDNRLQAGYEAPSDNWSLWASAVLGPKLQAQLARIVQIYEYPNNGTGTGGQESGWHVWMEKDLRSTGIQQVLSFFGHAPQDKGR